MSIELPSLPEPCDTFIRAELAGVIHWDNPKTTCFWVKYIENVNSTPLMAVGQSSDHQSSFTRRFTNQGLLIDKVSNSDQANVQSTDGSVTVNDWIFIALRRVDNDNGSMYIRKQGSDSFIYQNPFTVNLLFENNERICFGNNDIDLNGNVSGPEGVRVAEIGLWNAALSDAELDSLAAGLRPDELSAQSANLLGYWGKDVPTLTGSLADNQGGNDLRVYSKVDGVEGNGLVPPIYNSDHPIVNTTVSISMTIVQDSSDTPYINKTDLHYLVMEGVDINNLTQAYKGTDGTTDANGVMVLQVTNNIVTDNFIVLVFDPSGTNIYAADTLRMTGAATAE